VKTYVTPLRYPGGKRKLFNYTKRLLEINDLLGCTYIEPFAGGAGLALKLLDQKIVKNVVLNDLDRAIFAFWHTVLFNTDALVSKIDTTPVTLDEWYRQKRILKSKADAQDLELAFSTFFLNRTNRSGILNGGVIGGKKQNGQIKLDCRFNKKDLIERIYSISERKEQIQLYNMDAIKFLGLLKISDICNSSCFLFLDPPYYHKGPDLYVNYYQHTDHEKLAEVIDENLANPWIVTYDNVKEIKELYQKYNQAEYDLFYTAQEKQVGKEVMIYSDNVMPVSF